MDDIVINLQDALSQEYNFRQAGNNGEVIKIVIPKLVLERDARRKGISLDEFSNTYSGQWFFDQFEGLLLRPNKKTKKPGRVR